MKIPVYIVVDSVCELHMLSVTMLDLKTPLENSPEANSLMANKKISVRCYSCGDANNTAPVPRSISELALAYGIMTECGTIYETEISLFDTVLLTQGVSEI